MRSPCNRILPLLASRAAILGVAMGFAYLLLATGTRGEVRDDEDTPGSGTGTVIDPARPPAATARQRAVYVCLDDGIPMYADRPCGTAAIARTLDVVPPRAGDATSVAPPKPRAATRPRRLPVVETAGADRAVATRCDALQRQLAAVDDRMRAGYSAREAARLWQRWRELRERLRSARC